jgi:hypothetical protein
MLGCWKMCAWTLCATGSVKEFNATEKTEILQLLMQANIRVYVGVYMKR